MSHVCKTRKFEMALLHRKQGLLCDKYISDDGNEKLAMFVSLYFVLRYEVTSHFHNRQIMKTFKGKLLKAHALDFFIFFPLFLSLPWKSIDVQSQVETIALIIGLNSTKSTGLQGIKEHHIVPRTFHFFVPF